MGVARALTGPVRDLIFFMVSYASACGEKSVYSAFENAMNFGFHVPTPGGPPIALTNKKKEPFSQPVDGPGSRMTKARRAFFALKPLYSDAIYACWNDLVGRVPGPLQGEPILQNYDGQYRGNMAFLVAFVLKEPLDGLTLIGEVRLKNGVIKARALLDEALDEYERLYTLGVDHEKNYTELT